MAKFVFCEDSTLVQKMLQVALQTSAHEVFIASNGEEGLAVIERERPDFVFTDVTMPAMNGFELMTALKSRPDLAHIPVYLMTGASEASDIEEGYRRGAVGVFPKPFSPADLRAKVEELAAQRA